MDFHRPRPDDYWDPKTTGKDTYRDASAIMRARRQRLCAPGRVQEGVSVSDYAWKKPVFRRVFRRGGVRSAAGATLSATQAPLKSLRAVVRCAR